MLFAGFTMEEKQFCLQHTGLMQFLIDFLAYK